MPVLFKRSSGVYYILYEAEGKRRWKSTGVTRHSDAVRELLKFSESPSTLDPRMPLDAFASKFTSYARGTFAKKTTEIYERALNRFASHHKNKFLGSITSHDADMYRVERQQQVSPVTVNIELRSLKAAFSTAVRWKLIAENPWRGISMVKIPDKRPSYLSKEDFNKLMSVIQQQWMKELVLVAVSTGLRRGELLNLTWENIDFRNRLIHIQSSCSFKTKAGKRRAVPMNETVFNLLWNKSQKTLNKLVFSLKGRIMRGDLVSRRFRLGVKAAGLDPGLHFHSLRHTFATWLVQERISIYEVQKLLGHSSIAITQVYSHLAPNELHHAVNKIEVTMG